MARVLLGIRGMTTQERAQKVKDTLLKLEAVEQVDAGVDQQASVVYDEGSATVMDFIRALRHAGFAAGME